MRTNAFGTNAFDKAALRMNQAIQAKRGPMNVTQREKRERQEESDGMKLGELVRCYGAGQIVRERHAHAAMREALKEARYKLASYRDASSGEYQAGIEYTVLITRIDAALAAGEGV